MDERLKTLSQQIEEAQQALLNLSKEERESYHAQLRRLEKVLGYAAIVVEASDGDLLSDTTFNQISEGVAQITNNPAAAGPNAGSVADAILDALSRIPVASDREVEQELKDAAANFRRSATAHLNRFKNEVSQGRSEAAEHQDQLQQALTELQTAIADERTRLGQLGTEQTETFRKAQEERAEAADEQANKISEAVDLATARAKRQIETQVAEMERIKGEMVDLSGAVALVGTAERYGKEAKSQKQTANFWAAITILLALLAVAAAAFAATVEDPTDGEFIGKLAIGVILAGISRYTAIQSSRHRRREVEARALQLDLSAFGPFIEPLQAEQQEEERVIMTRKTFGKARGQDLGEDDPGPTPISQLLQRRKKEAEDAE